MFRRTKEHLEHGTDGPKVFAGYKREEVLKAMARTQTTLKGHYTDPDT